MSRPELGTSTSRWQEVADEAGITVWRRGIEGSSIVEFRGQGVIDAPLIQVAAVVGNTARGREWMDGCAESRTVERRSPTDAVVYNRVASPMFFVSDRDVVVEARAELRPEERALGIVFRDVAHASVPPSSNAVRMKTVFGRWDLVAVGSRSTLVSYQLHADPGGGLPSWIVNWASERMPLDTIAALRAQVRKPGYDADVEELQRSMDWSGY